MRVRPFLEIVWKTFLFGWHELFGAHDPVVTKRRFLHGRRLMSLECPCGAEWDDIEVGEDLGPAA